MPSPCWTRTHSPNPLAGPESITVPASGDADRGADRRGDVEALVRGRPSGRRSRRSPVRRPSGRRRRRRAGVGLRRSAPARSRRRPSAAACWRPRLGRGLGRRWPARPRGPCSAAARAPASVELPLDVGRLDQLGGVGQHGGVGGQGGRRGATGVRGRGRTVTASRRPSRPGRRRGSGSAPRSSLDAEPQHVGAVGGQGGSAPARADRPRPARRRPPRWRRSAAGSDEVSCRTGIDRWAPPAPAAAMRGQRGLRCARRPWGERCRATTFPSGPTRSDRTPVGGFGTKPPGSGSLSDRCDRAVIDPGATLTASRRPAEPVPSGH